jgi:outer membrane cobalamin receptor
MKQVALAITVNALLICVCNAAPDAEAIDEIVVTGSRIATPELETFSPTTVITSAALENTGTINVADSLRTLPSVGSSLLSTANSNFLTSNAGINTINLRNLGDPRTLVLVNGRRMTPGVAGSGIVDLNTIPTDFIDHVEIVTGAHRPSTARTRSPARSILSTRRTFKDLSCTGSMVSQDTTTMQLIRAA